MNDCYRCRLSFPTLSDWAEHMRKWHSFEHDGYSERDVDKKRPIRKFDL